MTSNRRLLDALSLLAPLALYTGHWLLFRHYVVDDSYITYRYSLSLAEGRGPYFNPGEHVEGYTNFLMMLLMAGVAKLGRAAAMPLAAKALGFGCGLLAVILAYALGSRLAAAREGRREPLAGMLAAGFVAASPGFAVNSASGLETTLYAALLGLGVLVGESMPRRGMWLTSALAFGAALLTRPDGALIFGVWWLAGVVYDRRSPAPDRLRQLLLGAIVVGSVFLLQVLFRVFAYDGEWLPNTYYAKQGGAGGSTWLYFEAGALAPFGGIAGAAFAAVMALAGGAGRGRLLVVAAPALVGVLTPFLVGVDWMLGERFVVPYLPLLAPVLAAGWLRSLRAVSMPDHARAAILAALVAVVWLSQDGERTRMRRHIEMDAQGFETGHVALARWLKTQCRPGDAVALMDVGIVGYELPQQRILDTSGLTDRYIARSPGAFLNKHYDPAYVLGQKPRFIIFVLQTDSNRELPRSFIPRFSTWIEDELYQRADFRQQYLDSAAPAEQPDRLGALARALLAERVFLHRFPGADYFLVVFRRQDASADGRLNLGER